MQYDFLIENDVLDLKHKKMKIILNNGIQKINFFKNIFWTKMFHLLNVLFIFFEKLIFLSKCIITLNR